MLVGFCSDHSFDARDMFDGDVRSNFNARMQHIHGHFVYDGYRAVQMQKDGYLVRHLVDQNLIDRRTYDSIISPATFPVLMEGIVRSQHRRDHRGHTRLPRVEERVVAKSSSSNRRDNEAQVPGIETAHHRHRSKRARQNWEDPVELISTPVIDPPDEVVPDAPAKSPSLAHSTLEMQKNVLLERLRILISNDTGRHYENQSIGPAGEETVATTVVNDLYQIDAEFVREESTSSCPSGRIESPQSQDHSNDGPSSGPTDTLSPDSDSFWLSEYAEDEERKLDEHHPIIQFTALDAARLVEAFRCWKRNRSEEDNPCYGVGRSNPAPNQDKGKGKDSATEKRKWEDNPESCNNATDSSGPSSDRAGCGKRRRISERKLTFACPYTKKNLVSHKGYCKYTLSRIRDVKQHLARCHRNSPYCSRCMGTFETEDERDDHIREA